MIKSRMLSIVALVAFVFVGCTPFVDVMDVEMVPNEERAAAFRVDVYKEREDHPQVAEFLGSVIGTSCKHLLTDPPATTGNAIEQLRIKAYRKGADAIVNVYCDKQGTDTYGTNCWQSITCTADAVIFDKKEYGLLFD